MREGVMIRVLGGLKRPFRRLARLDLLHIVGVCVVVLRWSGIGFAGETVLPRGKAPPAIVSGHFPDRVHEFVWRNWNAVEPAKLAKILRASVEQVTAIAESLGLPREA